MRRPTPGKGSSVSFKLFRSTVGDNEVGSVKC